MAGIHKDWCSHAKDPCDCGLTADPPYQPVKVANEPGSLIVRLRDHQKISGSGDNYAVVRVCAEHAERAAFARKAFAIKLRELDQVCVERDRLSLLAHNITKECRDLAILCERHDADLDSAINGTLRKAL